MKAGKLKVAVAGALGRMGRAVLHVAKENPGIEIVGAWEKVGNPSVGKDVGEVTGLGLLGVKLSGDAPEALRQAQVVIDFSTPSSSMGTLKAAASKRLPLVLGTTGLDAAQKKAVADYAKKVPCVHSSNFSVGVNILWKIAAEVARVTGEDYDIEIVDVHHHHKKDAPSGTAVTTAELLAKARGKSYDELAIFGRQGAEALRRRGEIGIHALRAGDVVGDHTVYFAGPHERLELVHRAHARENFASGALKAAFWLTQAKRKAGLYSMAQVLGL